VALSTSVRDMIAPDLARGSRRLVYLALKVWDSGAFCT
jgi:hypothetical protein